MVAQEGCEERFLLVKVASGSFPLGRRDCAMNRRCFRSLEETDLHMRSESVLEMLVEASEQRGHTRVSFWFGGVHWRC